VDPAASSGGLLVQSNVVNVDDVTVSTVGFAQSAAPSALLVLTQQPVLSVAASNVSGVSAVVQAGARADRPGVHMTDQAYNSEVSAYFRDDSPPPPAPFYYGPSPPGATSPFASVHSRADSRQSRTSYRSVSRQPHVLSRQSVMSVRSHASGRQSNHSQAADPVIDLMNRVLDKVAGDAAVQRADTDKMQARMDAEFARWEKDAVDRTRLQLRVEQLKKEAAMALPQPARPATTQRDSVTPATTGAFQPAPGDTHTLMTSADRHAPPPPTTVDSVNLFTAGVLTQSTVTAPNAHSLALSAPADNQHVALSVPDSLMTDHPQPLPPFDVMPAPGASNHPHRQLIDRALMSAPVI